MKPFFPPRRPCALGLRRRPLPIARLSITVLLIGAWLLAAGGPVQADDPLRPDHPERYVVQAGDTLWDIAGRFLRDPWRWREVWQANPGVTNPNLIFPGDVLEVTYSADGRPRIRSTAGGMRVVRLSPRVRVTELDQSIPTIPINAVAPFLTRPLVTDSAAIDDAPYVVSFPDERLLAGTGDRFFVRSVRDSRNDRFEVLRPGQQLRDPQTNQSLGYEALFVAEARLLRTGDPATLEVTRARVEVEAGDRLWPAREDAPIRSFTPVPAPLGLEGQIIAVLGGVTQIGQFDVVALNRGDREGVVVGQVFEVFSGGELRRDEVRARRRDWNWRNETPLDTSFWFGDWEVSGWQAPPWNDDALPLQRQATRQTTRYIVPDDRAGVIMVFRVFPRVSYALVMSAFRPLNVGQVVASPRNS